jgi:alanine transaminase
MDILELCKRESLVLMADEVYQDNVYRPDVKWVSFKKILRDAGSSFDDVGLVSMMSISKGFYGECGRRGGYMEIVGVSEDVHDQIYKMQSISLCANTSGQVCAACIMDPPQPGEDSHELYAQERGAILSSLARRAKKVADNLNLMRGVSCQPVDGALYAFPTITLPESVKDAAAKQNCSPEFIYCKELLEKTGIVCVPGAGFKQKAGTSHLRTTILPGENDIDTLLKLMKDFHEDFLTRWENTQ